MDDPDGDDAWTAGKVEVQVGDAGCECLHARAARAVKRYYNE